MIDFLKGKITPRDWAINGGIVFATLVLAALFYVVVYNGQLNRLDDIKQAHDEVRASLKKARETEKNIEDLRNTADKYEKLVEQFELRLPEQREIPQLLQRFENIGQELGLRLNLQSMAPTRSDNTEELPFKITATGDFHNIMRFINSLEREDRYFKISNIDLSQSDRGNRGAGESSSEVAEFTMSTFRFLATAPAESETATQ